MINRISSKAALILCLLLVLGGCSTPKTAPPPEPDAKTTSAATPSERSDIELDQRAGLCHVLLRGNLDEYTARRLRQTMSEIDLTACRSKRVLIDLQGGLVGSALSVGAIIKNRGFDTQIQPGTVCLTPCLLVFASGRERIMLPSVPPTRIGLSQIPRDEDFGHRVCATELTAPQALTLTRYLRAMLPLATANTVMQKLLAATCDRTEYLDAAAAQSLGLTTVVR